MSGTTSIKKILIISLCFYLASCSTNNKYILDRNSEYYGRAFIFYNFNNLHLESINGKKYKRKGLFSFEQEGDYVQAGYTTVEIRHHHSDKLKELCFVTNPGETINITFYPDESNQHTYPYSVFIKEDSPVGKIVDSRGSACGDFGKSAYKFKI